MIKEERLMLLSEYVKAKHYSSFDELIDNFKVSKATVRRDLIELENMGEVVLTRGGVSTANKSLGLESDYEIKKLECVEQKQRIGLAALQFLNPKDTVFLSAGTTCKCLAKNLNKLKNINLITNDIAIASELNNLENLNVHVTGGELRKNYYTLRGYAAENYLNNIKVDVAVLSCDSVNISTGCYVANADEVGVLKSAIKMANRIIMLADHTKFLSNSFVQFCTLSEIDILISDNELPAQFTSAFKNNNPKLILA